MTPANLLVVEDELIVAESIREKLEGLGYRVTSIATNVEEALSAIEAEAPELVLVDIKLPGEQDGVDLAARLKSEHALPVVYLTAYSDTPLLLRARETTPFGYILKPFREHELRSTIEMALHKHELERRLVRSEERYRTLFDGALDGILVIDPADRSILQANQAVRRILGYEPQDLAGTGFAALLSEVGREAAYDVFESSVSRDAVFEALEMLRADGTVTFVDVTASIVPWRDGDVVHLTMRDSTKRREAEISLMAALQEREILIKEVHHRVKNNLQLVSSLLDLQARASGSVAVQEVIGESQSRIASLSRIHEELYASGDLRQIELQSYLRGLISEIADAHSEEPEVRLDIAQTTMPVGPAILCGLLTNELLSNALKHGRAEADSGGLRISVGLHASDGEWVLSVSDAGPGFSDSVSFDNPQTMGLRLVSLIARQLRGSVAMRRVGELTTVEVTFPKPEGPELDAGPV